MTIGSPIAINDPKATSSTMIAARTPMISLLGIPPSANQSPPNSTRTPSRSSGAASSRIRAAVAFGCEPDSASIVIGATATAPPFEIWSGATWVTSFTEATRFRYAAISVW